MANGEAKNFPYPMTYETGRFLKETPVLSWLTGGLGGYLENIGMGAKNTYFDYLGAGDVVPTPTAHALPALAGALKGVKPGKWLKGFYHGAKYGNPDKIIREGFTEGQSAEIGLSGSSLAEDPLVSLKLFSSPSGGDEQMENVLRVFPKTKAEDVYNLPPDVYHSGVVPPGEQPVFYGKPNRAYKEAETFATRRQREDPELYSAVESVYDRSSDLAWRTHQLESRIYNIERQGKWLGSGTDAPQRLHIPPHLKTEHTRLKSEKQVLEDERLKLFKASQKAHEKLKMKTMLKPEVDVRHLDPMERHRLWKDVDAFDTLANATRDPEWGSDVLSQGQLMQHRKGVLESLNSLKGNKAYRVRFFSDKHGALDPTRTMQFWRDYGVSEKDINKFRMATLDLANTKSSLQRAITNARDVEFTIDPDQGARTLAERVQQPTPQAKVARKLYREFYNKLDAVESAYRNNWTLVKPTKGEVRKPTYTGYTYPKGPATAKIGDQYDTGEWDDMVLEAEGWFNKPKSSKDPGFSPEELSHGGPHLFDDYQKDWPKPNQNELDWLYSDIAQENEAQDFINFMEQGKAAKKAKLDELIKKSATQGTLSEEEITLALKLMEYK